LPSRNQIFTPNPARPPSPNPLLSGSGQQ
jgi:hypothetical protein